MYKRVLKPIFFLFNPEFVHEVLVLKGEFLGRFTFGRFLISALYKYQGPDISKTVDGIKYKTPILLAAGFDYNAKLSKILSSVSFGGEEVGSVTLRPCVGNKSPRLIRLPYSKSIIVNKGLKNDGVEKIIERLNSKKKISDFVVGVSIARTNDEHSVTLEDGVLDYVGSLERLEKNNVGDYYSINISCPNAFTGEMFTEPKNLNVLFEALDKVNRNKPLYVKMPISVTDEIFFEILEVLSTHNVQGVIIGNLQKNYDKISPLDNRPEKFQGGLSGKPCFDRSNELISKTKNKYDKRFTIIGCGGIFSYEDAKNKMDAGADLLQLITGMIYEGPGLIKSICEGISQSSSVGRARLS